MTEMVALWNETHPDIEVTFEAITSNFYPKLQAAIEAGTGAPDITQVDYPNLTSTVIAGDLKDITDDIGDIQSKFPSAVWEQVVINGNVYGIPQDIGTQVLYYRSDIFAAAGLSAPTTWDEYLADAAALKETNPDSYVTAFPTNGGAWFASLAWNNQSEWFSTEGDSWQVNLDDDASIEVADYWQRMLDNGYATGDQHWQPTWYKGLADGTYLTWIGPAWGVSALKSNAPDLSGKWAIAPLPQWSSGATSPVYWGGSLTAVTSVTTKTQAALEFVDWLNTSTESAELLSENVFPASIDGQTVPSVTQADSYFGGQTPSDFFSVTDAEAIPWLWGPTMTDTTNYLNDAIQSVVNGDTTMAEALRTVDAQTVAQLKEKGISVR